jgi:hypothetical protein
MEAAMDSVEVSAGTVEYREAGDPDGPPVVLLTVC